jgi:SAM-dependent methyltransferase
VSVHADRGRAESFGAVAELYERVRPSYPPALVEALLEGGVHDVLDVGTGTGIAGELLAARGCAVLGVEVDARMAARARARGLEVDVAPFERWKPAGRSFDLVIAAQAWHWIEPASGVRRAAGLLRPRGRLAVFWNLGDPPAPVRAVLDPIYDRLEPALGHGAQSPGVPRRQAAESAVEEIAGSGCFEPATIRAFPWSQRYDAESWVALLATHSDHQTLAPARREALLGAIGEALRALGDTFEMPYETVLVEARLAHHPPPMI